MLIVDDDEEVLEALRGHLQERMPDARILAAARPEAALEVAARERPHVVLSDLRMPGMDGLEMLRRHGRVDAKAAGVLMTAYPDVDVALAALNTAHVAYFFLKPVDPEQVLVVVADVLQGVRREVLRDQALEEATRLANELSARRPARDSGD